MGMRTGPALLAVAVLLTLAGCVPSTSHPTAAPSASATPVFASDAEALAAAEKAYAAYESVVDLSLQTVSDSQLSGVASGKALKGARVSVESFKKAGRSQEGDSTVSKARAADLSALTVAGALDGAAQIYACLDVSAVTVVDSDGIRVSAVTGQSVFPILVSLNWSPSSRKLLVTEESVWDGTDFCE